MSCNKPFLIKKKDGNFVSVPCGWCLQCRIDKRNEWEMRINFELSKQRGCFITLTYDEFHLPADEGLHKDHFQLFMKRLRKNLDQKIKYYAVGEYGEKGSVITGLHRPHYHAIIMGLSALKAAPLVSSAWQLGFTKSLPADRGCVRYVLKYMDKQIHGPEALKATYGDKQPPFALMSQGIGLQWLKENSELIDLTGGIPYNGKVRPIPNYYKVHYDIQENQTYTLQKRRKILEYMKLHNCTMIVALNRLGEVNEQELLDEINLKGR